MEAGRLTTQHSRGCFAPAFVSTTSARTELQHGRAGGLLQGQPLGLGLGDLRAVPWKRIQQDGSRLRQPVGRDRSDRWPNRGMHEPGGGKEHNTGEGNSGRHAGPFARHKFQTHRRH